MYRLLFFIIFLTSCSTKIDYHMATTRFDTPEVSGELFSGSAEWNIASSNKVTLGKIWSDSYIFSSTTVDETQYIESSFNLFNLTLELGLLPIVDIYSDTHWDSPSITGIKIQLWGDPRVKATEGTKIALKLGIGGGDGEKSTSTYTGIGATTSEVTSEMKINSYEAAIIIGYRKNKNVIGYLNSFYQYYKVDASLIKDGASAISASGISRNYGTLLGVRFGTTKHISIEAGYAVAKYENLKYDGGVIGVEAGYSW